MSDFIGIFLAVLLAILIAPHVQKHAGAILSGVTRINFVQRNGVLISTYLIVAVLTWTVVMIVLPQLYMMDYSFRHNLLPNDIGGPKDVHTLEHYRYLLFGRPGDVELMNWLHLKVFGRTILVSVLITLVDFALCYPIAYYMAQVAKGGKARLLVLCLILPFWVNEILRAFAFRILFGTGGVINVLLVGMGFVDEPIDFLKADVGLYAGLSYAYILLMIFPIYNAVESLDHNQVEAARDLGSPWWRIHYRVVMPHAKPGIASGCTMVFMLCAGALAAPQILGGPSSLWFTQIIYQWFNTGGNWPRGAAYAFVLLIICIVFVMAVMRVFNVRFGEIAK
ncbi:MAG: ABC transporter permease [Rhodospirillales bacterium]|nr:ABC transporter permease [Rhodospirillales bacterium]MDH3919906.1 ABC transporter permease [Rhodospirillales bacterium]MDH3968628.1 ABC transporter permease [Rhodospirillales bacterium]